MQINHCHALCTAKAHFKAMVVQDRKSKHKVIDFKLRTLRRKSTRLDRHSELYQRAEGVAANKTEGSRGKSRRSSSISETVVAVDIQPADPARVASQRALVSTMSCVPLSVSKIDDRQSSCPKSCMPQ